MTADQFSREEIAHLLKRAELALTPWRGHSEWEDLVAEARLAVWKRLARLEERPARSLLMTMVIHAARWAAVDYLRSTRAGRITTRGHWQRGGEAIPILSYDDSRVLNEPPWWDGGIEGVELRVAAGQIWEWVVVRATDRQREALLYHFQEGLSQKQAALKMGCLESAVYCHVQRALNHYRAAHGIGMRVVDTRRGRSSRPQGQLAAPRAVSHRPNCRRPKQGEEILVYQSRQKAWPKSMGR